METLLKETIRVLREYDKTPADVKWCGSKSFGWFTWDEFASVADRDYGFSGLLDDAHATGVLGELGQGTTRPAAEGH